MDTEAPYIAALIELHRGLDRKGPGDANFSRQILSSLPPLPLKPRLADLGCGSGAGALLLAQQFQNRVLAVDSSFVFIDELKTRAHRAGLDQLIVPIHGDMAKLDWPAGSIDLLWSEGAAYNLGFEQALHLWRPLLAPSGLMVLSELSWFKDNVPAPARAYWQAAYPQMGTEAENRERAQRSHLRVLATHRLPSQAWWVNYYEPLRRRMRSTEYTPIDPEVLRETAAEMQLFEQFSDAYGYTFYVLQAI